MRRSQVGADTAISIGDIPAGVADPLIRGSAAEDVQHGVAVDITTNWTALLSNSRLSAQPPQPAGSSMHRAL